MYLNTGNDTIDRNDRGLDVVRDVQEVIGEVCVVDSVDGRDGWRLSAVCYVLLNEAFPRLTADL